MAVRMLSQEDQDERAAYRELLKPKDIRDGLESYAKWLFGGTTALTALGALFSYVRPAGLAEGGKVLFSLALVLMGFSMAASAYALAPVWERTNPNSIERMKGAFEAQLAKRRRRLAVATLMFAGALVLAGAAPVGGTIFHRYVEGSARRLAIGYSATRDGKIVANATATRLAPGHWVEVSVARDGASLGGVRALPDPAGVGSATVVVERVQPGPVRIAASTSDPQDPAQAVTVMVPAPPPPEAPRAPRSGGEVKKKKSHRAVTLSPRTPAWRPGNP